MDIRTIAREVYESLEGENFDKIDHYYTLSQLLLFDSVPSSVAVEVILNEIARKEGKRIKPNIAVPELKLSSELVLRSLERINRDFYRPCFDVRKHRNFIVCLLTLLDKEGFKPLIEFISKFYGYEHLWWTDLLIPDR